MGGGWATGQEAVGKGKLSAYLRQVLARASICAHAQEQPIRWIDNKLI